MPEIDVVNSSPSELLASPLNITIQQNVTEDNNSSSQIQEPMETIPVEQIDITADKHFMESGACHPFLKPSKQDDDRDCDLNPTLSSRRFTFQSHLTSLYMIPKNTNSSSQNLKTTIILQLPKNSLPHMIGG